jgi:hypothetical protein
MSRGVALRHVQVAASKQEPGCVDCGILLKLHCVLSPSPFPFVNVCTIRMTGVVILVEHIVPQGDTLKEWNSFAIVLQQEFHGRLLTR